MRGNIFTYMWFFYFQWKTGLDPKYSGLVLKFDLACANNSGRGYTRSQCLVVKSKGNYTRSGICLVFVCLF